MYTCVYIYIDTCAHGIIYIYVYARTRKTKILIPRILGAGDFKRVSFSAANSACRVMSMEDTGQDQMLRNHLWPENSHRKPT